MRPDASTHNATPEYLRGLVARIGQPQEDIAERIGISPRAMRNYLKVGGKREAPYAVQFALECLAS